MKSKESPYSEAVKEALRAIGCLFESGDVIEIRALGVGRNQHSAGKIYAGYFNFENSCAIDAAIRLVDQSAGGVYVVLNRLNAELLSRSKNKLQAGLKNTTTDADIIEWRWLYIDVDPARPAGVSATEAEHDVALECALRIRQLLTDRGWPEPICADSGNGAHLLYRLPPLDLDRARDLVKRCLRSLSVRFSDQTVKVDEATGNASRIGKLYGTVARKGDSTPARPHRRSRLLETPEQIRPVSIQALEALASEAIVSAKPASKSAKQSPLAGFDIESWLADSGLDVIKGPEPYDGGRRWILRSCPFNPAHEKPAIILLAGGALVYSCLHTSCAENNWHALRHLIEPGYREWAQQRSSTGGKRQQSDAPGEHSDDAPLITDLSQIPSVFSYEAELNWCIDRMIAQRSVTLICAESGTGKTWLGYYIAGCVAHGAPVLGLAVRAGKVLYLDGENPLCVVKQRLFDLGISEHPNLTVWGGWNLSPPVGPHNPLVIEFARRHQGLIVYDSLIEFHPGSEQSSTETRTFMRHFRNLANLGATPIVLHHTGKSETSKLYRGSSDIKAAVDTAYLLARNSQLPEELGELSMTCFKARLAPGRNFAMKFIKRQGFIACEAFKPSRTVTEVITEILSETPFRNQTEILESALAQGCTKRQVLDCLRNGAWIRTPGPKNSTLYSLPTEGTGDDDQDS